MRIRPARPGDRPAVVALLENDGLPTEGVPDDLRRFLVAETEAGEVAGAVGLEDYGEHALLRSAVVGPAWRSRGVGRELTRRLLSEAGEHGCRSVFLLTTTAAEYFPRFGFRTVGREEVPPALHASAELRGACPASATVMRLDLATRDDGGGPG